MAFNDEFLTNGIEEDVLEEFRVTATDEVNKLGASDAFIVENLIKCRFYMLLAKLRYETDEAKRKYEVYEKEFNRYLKLSVSEKAKSVKSIKIFRG